MSGSPLIHGQFEHGFAWMAQPDELMQRSSTALAHGGKVWVVDPVRAPGIERQVEALGQPAGVVMTLGWHDRDVDWFSALWGVPVYVAPQLSAVLVKSPVQRVTQVPDSPFHLIDASMPLLRHAWTEGPLWWPEEAVLVTGDSLGRASYFIRPGEALAVHPLERVSPPVQLRGLAPRRIFCGHGSSLDSGAAEALNHALRTARSELPQAWLTSARATIRHFARR